MDAVESTTARPRLSVLIKALNEADKIERCLKSVRGATSSFDTEVILVDSNSEDETVAKALQFPEVTVVQFADVSDRGCGAAVQLAYQYARGDWLYVLDGDMEMSPGFLEQAFAAMQADPALAGVAGVLRDHQVRTQSDERRQELAAKLVAALPVEELGGGGLYRASAIRSASYLAHRGLQAYEEAELGMRLRAKGYRLVRLPVTAVWHEGHSETSWQMLVRLWRNGRAAAAGGLLREAWQRDWAPYAFRKFRYLLVLAGYDCAVLFLGGACFAMGRPVLAIACLATGVLTFAAILTLWKRSLRGGLWAFLTWHHAMVAALAGALRGVSQPAWSPIQGRMVRDARRWG